MISLSNLTNTTRPKKKAKRLGRGIGSGNGKTCGRGEKGSGSRSGYKMRLGYEGGQFRTFMKMPTRGFSNARFRKTYDIVNLGQIEQAFEDGDMVNAQTLADKGFLSGTTYGIKILGDGDLRKKVTIEVAALSRTAQEKLQQSGISFTLV